MKDKSVVVEVELSAKIPVDLFIEFKRECVNRRLTLKKGLKILIENAKTNKYKLLDKTVK